MKKEGYAASLIIAGLIALVMFYATMVYPETRQIMLRGKITVNIKDDYFPNIEVKRGVTVVFVNNGIKIHRIVSPFFNVELKPGEEFEYKFTKKGEFEYYCAYHPWERGVIIVK